MTETMNLRILKKFKPCKTHPNNLSFNIHLVTHLFISKCPLGANSFLLILGLKNFVLGVVSNKRRLNKFE